MSLKYTPEERRQALTVFAMCDSHARQAETALAEVGLGHVNVRTLQQWAYRDRRDEYAQIKAEVDTYVHARRADQYHALAAELGASGFEAARQTAEALAEGRIGVKELPRATRELVLAAAAASDKAEELSGNRPPPVKVDLTVIAAELTAIPGVRVRMPAREAAEERTQLPPAPDPE